LKWKIDVTITGRGRIPLKYNTAEDENARVSQEALEEDYRQMAADTEHEIEAEEWCEALIGDIDA